MRNKVPEAEMWTTCLRSVIVRKAIVYRELCLRDFIYCGIEVRTNLWAKKLEDESADTEGGTTPEKKTEVKLGRGCFTFERRMEPSFNTEGMKKRWAGDTKNWKENEREKELFLSWRHDLQHKKD